MYLYFPDMPCKFSLNVTSLAHVCHRRCRLSLICFNLSPPTVHSAKSEVGGGLYLSELRLYGWFVMYVLLMCIGHNTVGEEVNAVRIMCTFT